jgi:hypothetical protein
MSLSHELLIEEALELSSVAGVVANVCDHAEHNEAADPLEVRTAGRRLRGAALRLAAATGHSITSLYQERLHAIEGRNVLHHAEAFDGASMVTDTASWRELQLIQIKHDRFYHPDVIGLTKSEQLRHYALHLAKLAAATADTARGLVSQDDFVARRLPDVLLFGLKLATVTGEKLQHEPVDDASELVRFAPASVVGSPR